MTTKQLEDSVFLGILGETASALMEIGLKEIAFQRWNACETRPWELPKAPSNRVNRYKLHFETTQFEIEIRQSRSRPALTIRYTHTEMQKAIGKFHVYVADPNYTAKVVKIVQRLQNADVAGLLHKAIGGMDE